MLQKSVQEDWKEPVWDRVAAELARSGFAKTPKQCKERWTNYVSPAVVDDEWTPEDNLRLLQLHSTHSNHWKDIAPKFPGRTDNCVKNQLFSILRKALRKLSRHFLKDEMVLPINEIKPKIVTDFLRSKIPTPPGSPKAPRLTFATMRDLVEYFVEKRMNETALDLTPEQEEAVGQCFRRIYDMKWAHQRKIHHRKEQQTLLDCPVVQEKNSDNKAAPWVRSAAPGTTGRTPGWR